MVAPVRAAHAARPVVRRLEPADAEAFRAVRLEGIARHPRQFRGALEVEADQPLAAVADRLARDWVVGGFVAGELAGVGGLQRCTGAKLAHKALLWGMYVREAARGSGLADALVGALLEHARDEGLEQVVLTLAADNARARRLYERWGFECYGVEPRAVKVGDAHFDEALMVRRL